MRDQTVGEETSKNGDMEMSAARSDNRRADKAIKFELEDSNEPLDVMSDEDMNAETAEGSTSSSSDEANEENADVYEK